MPNAVSLAVRNLQRRPLPAVIWDLHEAPETMALAWEDGWSAERLLVADVLRGLTERFAAGAIAVAVPDREAIIASHDSSPQLVEVRAATVCQRGRAALPRGVPLVGQRRPGAGERQTRPWRSDLGRRLRPATPLRIGPRSAAQKVLTATGDSFTIGWLF